VRAPTLPETLSPERRGNFIYSPINLYLTSIYILIDSDPAVVYVIILLLALFEHFEDKVAADGWVVRVTKMLVNALLEGFNAFAKFFGVVRVGKFLENRARV
jgi:hypothetical protein